MTKFEVDHLVLISPTLADGQDYVEGQLGVRPVYGGRHPQIGTENALLGLGSEAYLEVIAPSSDVLNTSLQMPFGLADCSSPRLSTWAARSPDLNAAKSLLEDLGIPMGTLGKGERETPEGEMLSWTFSDIYQDRLGGLVPFLIQWGERHPCDELPLGGHILSMELQHPDTDQLGAVGNALGEDIAMFHALSPNLRVLIRTLSGKPLWLE
ncbi:MAG: VOC family protein [Pseudomonadota bacterium]